MKITRMSLPRRTFLRGMGSVLALPLLDAMVPAFTAVAKTAAAPVNRLGFIYFAHGSLTHREGSENSWTPIGEGRIEELSPILSPLAPFRDRLIVPTNLESPSALAISNGNHSRASASFLSASPTKRTEGTDVLSGITVDQVAAKKLGEKTPLPSLELALDHDYLVGNCDGGYSCAYISSLSWSSPTTPLPAENNPRVVFERLFGDGGTGEERLARIKANRSILDSMSEDFSRLKVALGAGDLTKVNEYLDSVREVERRIQLAEKQPDDLLTSLDQPIGVPENWEEHAKLMFDLQVLAFQADITRVISFQLCRELNTRAYPEIGVANAHHAISHHQGDPAKLAALAKVNTYHVGLFAEFLKNLEAVQEGDGNLLDNGMYLYGSGMGDGNLHDHRKLPIVLVGGGAGRLKGGRHLNYRKPRPMGNLLLSLLDKVGVPLDSFGDSTGRLELEPLSDV